MWDRRPPHLPVRARLRSRAAFSLATSVALSKRDCAEHLTHQDRGRHILGEMIWRAGPHAGASEPLEVGEACTAVAANRSGLWIRMVRTPSPVMAFRSQTRPGRRRLGKAGQARFVAHRLALSGQAALPCAFADVARTDLRRERWRTILAMLRPTCPAGKR